MLTGKQGEQPERTQAALEAEDQPDVAVTHPPQHADLIETKMLTGIFIGPSVEYGAVRCHPFSARYPAAYSTLPSRFCNHQGSKPNY